MSNSSADIEEPQGDPGEISRAAGDLSRQSSSFWDTSQQLRSLPGSLTTWQGPASVAFAGTALAYADDAAAASDALALAARVAQAFADELDDAQADARRAQGEASAARAQIARAQAKLAAARAGIAAAKAALGAGMPVASSLLEVAEADERQAKIDLERARDDLERALADQRKANTRAGQASRGLQGALQVELGLRNPASLPPLTPLPRLAGPGRTGADPWRSLSALLEALGGGIAFAPVELKRARAGAARARRAAAEYGRGRIDPGLTPKERAELNQRYQNRTGLLAELEGKMPALRNVSRLGRALGPLGVLAQYQANRGKMTKTENAMRTGASTVVGSLAATGATVLCSPSVIGAPACGMAAGVGGSWAGDKAAGFAYDNPKLSAAVATAVLAKDPGPLANEVLDRIKGGGG
jgi:hypothetical protein